MVCGSLLSIRMSANLGNRDIEVHGAEGGRSRRRVAEDEYRQGKSSSFLLQLSDFPFS